jgi:hypothetical protein
MKDLIYSFEGVELWGLRQDKWRLTIYQLVKNNKVIAETYRSARFAPGLELFEKECKFQRGGFLSDIGSYFYKRTEKGTTKFYLPININADQPFGPSTFKEIDIIEKPDGYFKLKNEKI